METINIEADIWLRSLDTETGLRGAGGGQKKQTPPVLGCGEAFSLKQKHSVNKTNRTK